MNPTQVKRVFGLDFLRALAISLVVLSHITFLVVPSSESIIVVSLRILGAVGVDLFFVLSGFLIGGIILKHIELEKTNTKDLIIFWKRRWLRTLPNYFLIFLINVLIFLILGKNLPENTGLFIPFLQNIFRQHPDFFTEAWSLSIEEYAYLLLPLILFLSFKLINSKEKSKHFFWITIILICLLNLFKFSFYLNANINSYSDWSSMFRKVVIYRVDSIYIGFIVVYLVRKFSISSEKNKNILLILGVLIFISTHLIIFIFNLIPEINLGFYVFGYLQLVILSLALLFPYFSTLNYYGIFVKPIQFISIHSYSIYLINYSIVLLSLKEIFDIESMTLFELGSLIILYLSFTIILSFLLYKYFESPILRYRDKIYKRKIRS